MNALLNGTRSSLLTSTGCNDPVVNPPVVCNSTTINASTKVGTTSRLFTWNKINEAISYNIQYKLVSDSTW
jgi:hypothetical protein